MGSTLEEVKEANFKEYCFLPQGKTTRGSNRKSEAFQPHEDGHYHLQIYHSNGMKDWALNAYSDRKGYIQSQKEWIEEHLDRRIQLFFQQAILCYNTPFFYDAEGAEDQMGRGNKSKGTEAAHSSTFPCLYAYLRDANGAIIPSTKFAFLRHSHADHQHNSTVELPIEVNKSDTLLDGKAGEQKLRSAGLKIINDTAQGKINPTKATKRFLRVFEQRLNSMIPEIKKDDLRRVVLKVYLKHLCEVRAEIKESPQIFDQIMGVNLVTSESEKVLRKVVYQKRYQLIQQSEFIDSQIAKKIFEVQKKILGTTNKSVKNIDYRLRYVLLNQASSTQERKFLEKFFCTSIDQLSYNLENKQQKLRRVTNDVTRFATQHEDEIKDLRKELRVFQRALQKLELEFRSKLFRGLRVDFKDWYQSEFVDHFKGLYPHEPMSQPMVSRLENPGKLPTGILYASPESQRRKEMDIPKAEKIAHAFGVDVGLFLPGLIGSEY